MNKEVWEAIERIAITQKTSVSGLARKAGLNPTTFNRSKRTSAAGQERWPSTRSINQVLKATNLTWEDFPKFMRKKVAPNPNST